MNKFEQTNFENVLQVNQRLEIMLAAVPGKKFASRIEEVHDDHLVIAMPMTKGQPIILNHGSKFFARLVVHQSAYQLTCTFIDKRLNPIPVWLVSRPADIKKIQQRAFVRLDSSMPVRWQFLTETEDDPLISSTIRDISGGGVRIITKNPVPLGSKLKVMIDLPGIGPLELSSEVVRIDQPQADLPIFWVGTKFLDIPENIRSKIIKYIFKKQVEERQKGL
ncbi:PilZ domain-containing protein|uniref:C-di-GMP-binding flagellar brake protein YcgR, contains PilZNR and PilZ domains n=1 Tax=Dendrosporobacter quercicolus TaxID=146817 RepID=A0A1G9MHP1_9FIRM|nr:flagellar brake domain-containing protein [Dendrosporobacter quercicolus]NSL47041.1 PilZ domain-containing protein [Dendrosporobacter quercicolus DSM 1736]SDL73729.1 c-di-GMP-binding flagellar brake protein YcgR, contains PilZNR and PilZ domains [Dendrosporobacter quercicolus]